MVRLTAPSDTTKMLTHPVIDAAVSPCVACKATGKEEVFCEFGIPILRCRSCGHVISTYVNDQHYDQYFAHEVQDQERFWWDEAHGKMYADFGDLFLRNRSGRLLDVGAGLGYFVRFVMSHAGWDAVGYEISPPAVEYAHSELGLKGHMFPGAVEHSGFAAGSFDVVTMWDVIEHIPNPDIILQYLIHVLKPGGILFLATPNASAQVFKARIKARLLGMREGVHYLEARDHVNLYTQSSLRMVLLRSGFDRVRFMHIHPIQSVSGSRNPALRAAKNAWYLAGKMVSAITGDKVNANNNLFAVATKRR